MTSKLANIKANGGKAPSATPVTVSRLAARLGSMVRGLDRIIPGLGLAHVRLLGLDEVEAIEEQVFRVMRDRDIELSVVTAATFEAARAVRSLALAVRDPEDHSRPFGTLAEWAGTDEDPGVGADIIAAAWHVYGDVREQLDPMPGVITDELLAQVAAAVQKKNPTLLRSFGVSMLAHYLVTTAARPDPSVTMKSEDGPSSQV